MKKKSLVMMLASLSLVGTIMVGATLAYFTDQTGAVTNTFTVGANVDIDLFENVKQDTGNENYVVIPTTNPATNPERVPAGSGAEFVKMYPGLTLNKAPFVEKTSTSSDCFVRVTVTGVQTLESKGFTVTFPGTDWEKVDGNASSKDGIYQFKYKLDASRPKTTDLFTKVTFNANNQTIPTEIPQIVVKAYAVQADGFTGATDVEKANNAFAAELAGTTKTGSNTSKVEDVLMRP